MTIKAIPIICDARDCEREITTLTLYANERSVFTCDDHRPENAVPLTERWRADDMAGTTMKTHDVAQSSGS